MLAARLKTRPDTNRLRDAACFEILCVGPAEAGPTCFC